MQQLDSRAVWFFFISIILRWPFIFGFLGISFIFNAEVGVQTNFPFIWFVVPLVAVLLVIFWVWSKLTFHYYKYELREDGFRKEHGIIWKKYVTIPYDRIQNVDIYRGLVARIIGLSDLQIQTAGGITSGSYGAYSEGRLPGLSAQVAEELRDELVKRARSSRGQGL